MKPIRGHITIEAPLHTVFDFVADERNEPRYNPRMAWEKKTTSGPIGTRQERNNRTALKEYLERPSPQWKRLQPGSEFLPPEEDGGESDGAEAEHQR